MSMLNIDALHETPLTRAPFEFIIVPGFIKQAAAAALATDFPQINQPGSFPISEVNYGPGFKALLDELQGPVFNLAMSDKFQIDLSGYPTLVTVRGHCRKKDGQIHTDTETKIITVLIYMNEQWEHPGGRLRLLRNGHDLEDKITEVPPVWGTLLAFRRADNSFHGHEPFEGPRRVIQLNWVTSEDVVMRELGRHKVSARIKKLNPFA